MSSCTGASCATCAPTSVPAPVLVAAIVADLAALGAFIALRGAQDPFVVVGAIAAVAGIFGFEARYLRHRASERGKPTASS